MSSDDNVLSLVKRLEQKRLDTGEWGVFAEPNVLSDLLRALTAHGGAGPAIGLLAPDGGPGDLDAAYVGWMLTPADARELAGMLKRYADECEMGYPDV